MSKQKRKRKSCSTQFPMSKVKSICFSSISIVQLKELTENPSSVKINRTTQNECLLSKESHEMSVYVFRERERERISQNTCKTPPPISRSKSSTLKHDTRRPCSKLDYKEGDLLRSAIIILKRNKNSYRITN